MMSHHPGSCARLLLTWWSVVAATVALNAAHQPVWAGETASAQGDSAHGDPPVEDAGQTKLMVWPERLVTSHAYPARFIAVAVHADGTEQRLTAEEGLVAEVEDVGVASVDSAGRVVAHREGTTLLRVRWRDQLATAEILCESVEPVEPDFALDVSAVLTKSGCNSGSCHGSLHGKAGFRLSLLGDDPKFDFESITHRQGGRRIDWIDPDSSLLLRKPSGALAHRGGLRLEADTPGYDLVRRWIEAGAPSPEEEPADETEVPRPQPERVRHLEVYPREAWLAPPHRDHQVVVVAELADGRRRDVTPWARYEASVVSGARVTPDGAVHAERPMDVGVTAHYLDAKAHARLVFLEHVGATDGATETTEGPLQPIDRLVNDRLDRMRIAPLPQVAPERFLRRLYLAVAGRLPTADEVRQFRETPAEQRRQVWIERALVDPGYGDMWALRWSDLLRNEQKVMSPEGASQWRAWIADQFASDVPLDRFIRETIATVGSTYETPAASFHRTHRQPQVAAEALGQVFLGIRIQCAQCHNHPFDRWKQDDYYGLAAYFTTIERKAIDNNPRDNLDSHVITGDEIISLAARAPRIRHPGLSREVPPKPIDQPAWDPASLEATADAPLEALAQWLTVDNRAMARNMANRIWYYVMGRGIVDPPDDFRSSNPPSNPELLEYLTDRLIESGFSTRSLMREILNSETFARETISQESTQESLDGAPVFAGYPLRRMSAEVLLDAISDATGVPSRIRIPESKEPAMVRAVRFAGIPRDGFLRTFGKPDRLLSCECERSGDPSLSQSLQMLNGEEIRKKIGHRPNIIDHLQKSAGEDSRDFLERLYLTVLTRAPTEDEVRVMSDYLTASEDPRAAAEDILWALINSQEFPWIR